MKQINSSHNETYKHLKQLATSAKHRRRNNQTLLEGIHLCESYLQHSGQPLMCVYTTAAVENPEVAKILSTCEELAVPSILLSEGSFKPISGVAASVGVLFVIAIPAQTTPLQLPGSALLLENIQNPTNTGAILRTAAAAGIQHVFTSAGSASAWSPKVLRAGMGAHFALQIYEDCDLATLIQNANMQILATSLEATQTIYQKDLAQDTTWIVGNEGNGVSDELLALNVKKVIIPQQPGVESLNVAAATAVCLFEQARQVSLAVIA